MLGDRPGVAAYFDGRGLALMRRDLVACARVYQEAPRGWLYVAVEGQGVLGWAVIQQRNTAVAEISWLAIAPAHQRQGIGTALVGCLIQALKAEGLRLLLVKTLAAEANYPPYEITRRFYERLGFVHLETIHPYPGWGLENPCALYVQVL